MKIAEELRRAVLQAGIEGRLTGGRCEGWRFVRLGDIVAKKIKRGKSPKYAPHSNTLVFAQKCNTKRGNIDLSLALYLDESTIGKYPQEEFMLDGDIILNSTGRGTLGRVGQYNTTDNPQNMPLVPDSHVTIIRPMQNISSEFVCYVLKHYQPHIETLGEGSTNQTELSAKKVANLLIPLPPLNEQHRIVSRLDSILPLIAELEAAENELEAIERRFPGDMRDSLLQAAIEGKLTGGTEGWRWVRLGDVVRVISGTSYEKHEVCKNGIRIIRGGNLVDEKIVLKEDDVFLPYQYTNKEKQVQQNDILIIASTGSLKGIGRAAFVDTNFDEPIQIGAFLRIIRPVDSSLADYLKVIFAGQYYRSHISSVVNGIGIKNIREKHITELIIPLPPLEQQHKIVSRLNELLPLCESLGKTLQ